LLVVCLSAFQCFEPIVFIRNNYSEHVVVEIWSGDDIFYDLGTVVAYDLDSEVSLKKIKMNSTGEAVPNENGSQTMLIIVGTIQGGSYAYLSSITVNKSGGDETYTIDSTGAINDSYY